MENITPLTDRSLRFAAKIVGLYNYLTESKHETVLSAQLMRCGTAVGANANQAASALTIGESSDSLRTALKEAADTEYLLKLLMQSGYLEKEHGASVLTECLEIKRLILAAYKTTEI